MKQRGTTLIAFDETSSFPPLSGLLNCGTDHGYIDSVMPRSMNGSVATGMLLVLLCACSQGRSQQNGSCLPQDPVITPATAAPGETIEIASAGFNDTSDCEPSLPEGATYRIRVKSLDGGDSIEVRELAPQEDGGLVAHVEVPSEFPPGRAAVDLLVDGARLFCEVDQSIECGRSTALLEVAETH